MYYLRKLATLVFFELQMKCILTARYCWFLRFTFQDYHPTTIPWPDWVSKLANVSHFLLTFACSANFYIYFAKHSQKMQKLMKFRKWFSKQPVQEPETEAQSTHFLGVAAAATPSRRSSSAYSSVKRGRSPNASIYSANHQRNARSDTIKR